MATHQACYHTRSNSLPSRPHPVTSKFDDVLNRIRSSKPAFTSFSSSSIREDLNGLQDLYNCMEKALELPLTQQSLACQEKWVINELLDGSLRTLDVCDSARDSLLQVKELVQEIQSILRRRRGGKIELASEVKKLENSRKAMRKAIQKGVANTKSTQSKSTKESETGIVTMSKEMEAVTLTVFESLASLISKPRGRSKLNRWSLVSKLMQPKRVAHEEEETIANNLENADEALQKLICHKTSKLDYNMLVENTQSELKIFELCIQDLEEGLECLGRCMIKNRAVLLNMLNN